jgi:hypothetical protein
MSSQWTDAIGRCAAAVTFVGARVVKDSYIEKRNIMEHVEKILNPLDIVKFMTAHGATLMKLVAIVEADPTLVADTIKLIKK